MRDAAVSFAFFAGLTIVLVVVVRKLADSTFWPSRRKVLIGFSVLTAYGAVASAAQFIWRWMR